jgi:hypothetical protein
LTFRRRSGQNEEHSGTPGDGGTMKLRFAILLMLVSAPAAFAQWQWGRPQTPRSGACFFRDADFRGDYFCLRDGERWPAVPRGFNDTISSIRTFGGARLRIFYDDNFRGVSLLVDRNIRNLQRVPRADSPRNSWNDRISSIAVFRDRDEWGPRPGGPPPRRY